jgi:hypothetical protein
MEKILSDNGAVLVVVYLIAHDGFGPQHIRPQFSNLIADFDYSVVHYK